ncbi:MAG: hypothetical protein ACRBBR_05135 [Cellvibrionaceae bacterium]
MSESKRYERLKSESIKNTINLVNDKALEYVESQINKYFFEGKDKNCFDWLINLSQLKSTYSCLATLSIIEKKRMDKLEITYAYLKCYIECNIKVPIFFSSVHKSYSYFEGRVNNDVCLCLVLALIFDDRPMLAEGLRLVEGLRNTDFSGQFVADMPYLDFVSNLARLDLSKELVGSEYETSFNEVFNSWNDLGGLSPLIETLLDYHLFVGQPGKNYRSEEHEKYYPSIGYASPFDTYDLSVMPYEVIAIYKVRQRQGLPFPEIDHPLLSNELLGLFKENLASDYSDELLEKIYDFINSKK